MKNDGSGYFALAREGDAAIKILFAFSQGVRSLAHSAPHTRTCGARQLIIQ
jgi:hypothetical protein